MIKFIYVFLLVAIPLVTGLLISCILDLVFNQFGNSGEAKGRGK